MSNPIEIKIEKSEIENLKNFFRATQKQLNTASFVALSQTITWAKNQLVKRVAAKMKLQPKPFTEKNGKGTARILTHINEDNKSATCWFGLYRISVARFKPRQVGKVAKGRKRRKNTRAGVVAGLGGSVFRQGAFLMKLRKKDGSSAVIPFQVMNRIGKKRLPIKKEVIAYDFVADEVQRTLLPELPPRLEYTLRQKLQWQTEKN